MNDQILRTLDPATTPADLDVAHDPAAQQLLARITTADPASAPVALPQRMHRRRVGLALAATAAAGATALAAPGFLGGPTPAAAWTPVPTSLSAAELDAAADECLDDGFWHFLPGRQGPQLRTYLGERRGGWTLLYSATPDGMTEQVCMLRNGKPFGAHGQVPGPGAQTVTVAADGAYGSIGGVMSTETGSHRSSTGIVGADVLGLVLHTEAQGPVTATVNDGHFAAWWPDVPVTEASENADTTPSFTHVTLTLRDGSSKRLGVDEFTGNSLESLTTPDTGGSPM